MRLLSPVALIVACWTLTALMAAMALAMPQRFDLMPVFLYREALDLAAFAPAGAFWLVSALAVMVLADALCRQGLPAVRTFAPGVDLKRAAWLTFGTNLLFLGVTCLWIVMTARQVGGLSQLAALTMIDSLSARDLLLENKLFTGMRLFYAALPAFGCLAAAILAAGPRDASARHLCIFTLVLNGVALTLLPLVMSQRLLLLQFLLSSYLVTCLVRGRLVGLPWLGLGIVLFLVVWVLRESLTNPLIHRSAIDIGMQKLAFYFVNDLWNAFAPIGADLPHAWGAVSLRGFMFLTFTDGIFDRMLHDRMLALEAFRGGGEFPLFTAPYVDFGPLGGALFLALAAVLFRLAFHLGQQSLGWAAIYGQIGAALLFSSHGLYVTHQNLLFSLLVIGLLMRAARPAVRPIAGLA
jgi:hypothetical protein